MKLVASGGTRSDGNSNHSGESHQNEGAMLPMAESCALDPDDDLEEDELYPEGKF